ncbi:uncharacterized protein LOC112083444 [Eutrema salsugineum]|uniref:uncharacterized protein LOC112083444 n=1 Tax=Eutrema salsugineum TaxID=72664 RepID=UPI000CECF28E|nr:uncharacterized protein LOC112083444 [Eutrema salsugineum]
MAESELVSKKIQGSLGKLHGEVTEIKRGWEKLTKANAELTKVNKDSGIRFALLDKQLELVSQTLAQIEANSFQGSKQKGIATSYGAIDQRKFVTKSRYANFRWETFFCMDCSS